MGVIVTAQNTKKLVASAMMRPSRSGLLVDVGPVDAAASVLDVVVVVDVMLFVLRCVL